MALFCAFICRLLYALSSFPTFFSIWTFHRCALNAIGYSQRRNIRADSQPRAQLHFAMRRLTIEWVCYWKANFTPSSDYKVPYLLRDYTARYRSLPEIQISDAASVPVPVISIKEPGCLNLDLHSTFVGLWSVLHIDDTSWK